MRKWLHTSNKPVMTNLVSTPGVLSYWTLSILCHYFLEVSTFAYPQTVLFPYQFPHRATKTQLWSFLSSKPTIVTPCYSESKSTISRCIYWASLLYGDTVLDHTSHPAVPWAHQAYSQLRLELYCLLPIRSLLKYHHSSIHKQDGNFKWKSFLGISQFLQLFLRQGLTILLTRPSEYYY